MQDASKTGDFRSTPIKAQASQINANDKAGSDCTSAIEIIYDDNGDNYHFDKNTTITSDPTSRQEMDGHSEISDDGSVAPSKEVDRFGFVGGNQYTDPTVDSTHIPLEVLRMRELKWIDMLENWDKWMTKKFKKVKSRCRKGIPDSLRARSWQLLTGSSALLAANPGRYQGYLDSHGNPSCLDEIRKDVSRQYPHHELFMKDQGQGQEDLYSVLMAYSVHNPTVGYCQAQGPLAAVLLTLMPAEQAFWCFLTVCEKYLPGYYNTGLEAVQIDSMVLFGLLKKACPVAYKHLKKQKVEPILWMTDWFMCLFSRTLPWPSVLRVWDMFLCEGMKIIFQVAIVLVKSVLGTGEQIHRCSTFYDTLDLLRKIPIEYMESDYIAREVSNLRISEKDLEKEHESQLKKWNAAKSQKLQKNNSSQVSAPTSPVLGTTATTVPPTSISTLVVTTPTASASKTPQVTTSSSLPLPSSFVSHLSLSPVPVNGSTTSQILLSNSPESVPSRMEQQFNNDKLDDAALVTADAKEAGMAISGATSDHHLVNMSDVLQLSAKDQEQKKDNTVSTEEIKKSGGHKQLPHQQLPHHQLPHQQLSHQQLPHQQQLLNQQLKLAAQPTSSSMTALPPSQTSESKKKNKTTFRFGWNRPRQSKSTTHVDK